MTFHMKRTTLVLDERYFTELKKTAAAEGRTLSNLVDELIRTGLAHRGRPKARGSRKLPSFSMGRPLVDLADRDQLAERMEQPR